MRQLIRAELKMKITITNSRYTPLAYETVVKFQYEGFSYPRVWISGRNPEFLPGSVEKAEV